MLVKPRYRRRDIASHSLDPCPASTTSSSSATHSSVPTIAFTQSTDLTNSHTLARDDTSLACYHHNTLYRDVTSCNICPTERADNCDTIAVSPCTTNVQRTVSNSSLLIMSRASHANSDNGSCGSADSYVSASSNLMSDDLVTCGAGPLSDKSSAVLLSTYHKSDLEVCRSVVHSKSTSVQPQKVTTTLNLTFKRKTEIKLNVSLMNGIRNDLLLSHRKLCMLNIPFFKSTSAAPLVLASERNLRQHSSTGLSVSTVEFRDQTLLIPSNSNALAVIPDDRTNHRVDPEKKHQISTCVSRELSHSFPKSSKSPFSLFGMRKMSKDKSTRSILHQSAVTISRRLSLRSRKLQKVKRKCGGKPAICTSTQTHMIGDVNYSTLPKWLEVQPGLSSLFVSFQCSSYHRFLVKLFFFICCFVLPA